jgi:flagellar biosynthesis anti-sigma factor FlgM
MKIDNNLGGLNLDRAGSAAPANRYTSGAPDNGQGANSHDQINLSDLSQQLRSLETDSPERTEKVRALAAAFAAGTYKVDAAEVSRRLVDDSIGL